MGCKRLIWVMLGSGLLLAGCGPSSFEQRLARHRLEISPLVDFGTKEDIAELYGPPHRKEVLDDTEFWSYQFNVDRRIATSVYYGSYYSPHHYDGYWYRPYDFGYAYYGPPSYYTYSRPYELIFKFDSEGILRHWRIRQGDDY